jgi:hypothetical protein
MQFLYALPFLRYYIPGRAEYSRLLKKAVEYEGARTSKRVVSFKWQAEQKEAFEAVKMAVVKNALTGGDPERQYHLATDASETGLG